MSCAYTNTCIPLEETDGISGSRGGKEAHLTTTENNYCKKNIHTKAIVGLKTLNKKRLLKTTTEFFFICKSKTRVLSAHPVKGEGGGGEGRGGGGYRTKIKSCWRTSRGHPVEGDNVSSDILDSAFVATVPGVSCGAGMAEDTRRDAVCGA